MGFTKFLMEQRNVVHAMQHSDGHGPARNPNTKGWKADACFEPQVISLKLQTFDKLIPHADFVRVEELPKESHK